MGTTSRQNVNGQIFARGHRLNSCLPVTVKMESIDPLPKPIEETTYYFLLCLVTPRYIQAHFL